MKNLMFQGPVYDSSGVAAFVRNQAKSLYKYKDRFNTVCIEPPQYMPYNENITPELMELLENSRNMDIRNCTVLKASWCEEWFPTIARRPKKFIGYTAVEGTRIPMSWVDIMNDDDVDSVFCMSNPLKKMWTDCGVNRDKIIVIGHGIEPKWFNPEIIPREYPQLKDKFIFGYLNGWDLFKGDKDRKGPEILLKAFTQEFKPTENVALLFKPNLIYSRNPNQLNEVMEKILSAKVPSNIIVETQNFRETELGSIYRKMDCYVNPTKGEGFGITIAEAMACNVPVIVPNNSKAGYMDFCNKDTAHFIDIEREEYIDSRIMGHIYSNSKWAIPSVDSLRKKMRQVYEDRNELKRTISPAREMILKNYTWDKCTERMLDVICR